MGNTMGGVFFMGEIKEGTTNSGGNLERPMTAKPAYPPQKQILSGSTLKIRVSKEDLAQFVETGYRIYDKMAESLGLTVPELTKYIEHGEIYWEFNVNELFRRFIRDEIKVVNVSSQAKGGVKLMARINLFKRRVQYWFISYREYYSMDVDGKKQLCKTDYQACIDSHPFDWLKYYLKQAKVIVGFRQPEIIFHFMRKISKTEWDNWPGTKWSSLVVKNGGEVN
jgi:hypothetical protein